MATKKSTKKNNAKKAQEVGIEFDFTNVCDTVQSNTSLTKESLAPEPDCGECCCDSCGKARKCTNSQLKDHLYDIELEEVVQRSIETNDPHILKPYLVSSNAPKKPSLWQRIKAWFRKLR